MKWNTGLPRKSGEYVCFTKYGEIKTYDYSEHHKCFNCVDWLTKEEANKYSLNNSVVKWISLKTFLTKEGL